MHFSETQFQVCQKSRFVLSTPRNCACTAASHSTLLSVSSRVVLCGAAARTLILLYRRFISFLKASDYFSINNAGKTISVQERNQIASDEKLCGGCWNEFVTGGLKYVEGYNI
jgi:hypothetical protein